MVFRRGYEVIFPASKRMTLTFRTLVNLQLYGVGRVRVLCSMGDDIYHSIGALRNALPFHEMEEPPG